jgi:hypothetical protein
VRGATRGAKYEPRGRDLGQRTLKIILQFIFKKKLIEHEIHQNNHFVINADDDKLFSLSL